MLPRFSIAEYKGLIAAPGTPKDCVIPSFSNTKTAASIARILAMINLVNKSYEIKNDHIHYF
jgi:hypothetical protein